MFNNSDFFNLLSRFYNVDVESELLHQPRYDRVAIRSAPLTTATTLEVRQKLEDLRYFEMFRHVYRHV